MKFMYFEHPKDESLYGIDRNWQHITNAMKSDESWLLTAI